MAQTPPATVQCAKCGEPYATAELLCRKCGGGLVKICGQCGFKNSVAKNYCDACGTGITVIAPPAGTSGPAPDAEIPMTAVRKLPPAGASGFALPPAGQSSELPPMPEDTFSPIPPPVQTAPHTLTKRSEKIQNAVLLSCLIMAGAFGWHKYQDFHKPENAVPRLAVQYLDALANHDTDGAYALLSHNSKTQCSAAQFAALRGETPWTWSDLSVVRIEDGAALVKYKLHVEGHEPKDDFLFFLLEKGQWVRPFNWNLLKRAEEAFDRQDPDMALILAQAAVEINPRDPMARGYLCEAVYYRRIAEEIERECQLALDLSRSYPSSLSLKSLYHLHAILGDTYKNALRKLPDAIIQYDMMLGFPDLAPGDQCDLLLARADAKGALGQAASALHDLQQASALCIKPNDLEFIQRKMALLQGRGGR